ncbi:MAG: glycosyltransferase [Ignavibacteria bacterium]|nr:glycosyltransferase [Ignavibacteria bacterium]
MEIATLENIILAGYFISLCVLFGFGISAFTMVYHHLKHRYDEEPELNDLKTQFGDETNFPVVTIQLPLYNELYVSQRVIEACCNISYPKEKLEIQVLDDSTDETTLVVSESVSKYQRLGFDIKHIRRGSREGFKAGALKFGMETARGEYIAIFDADFVPYSDFLEQTIPYFENEKIGMVQTRWEHLNGDNSLITKIQSLALDGHFIMEQNVRNKAGYFINFNGTGGVWRKSCILDAGNWEADTITEDLDLSYRAQLRGWKFKFLPYVTSPAELPSEINALKAQQFRWTKGAVEVARKMLWKVWKSDIPFHIKVHSTFHLTNNIVFPFIFLAGLFNVPIVFIKHQGGFETYFQIMSIFVLAFIGSFLFYMLAQKELYTDWRKRLLLFPLFMSGSMGFAVNNTRAVIEGLFKKKSEFVRTPKYNLSNTSSDRLKNQNVEFEWLNKKYVPLHVSLSVIFESLLAVYFILGIFMSLYFVEIAALPFQLLFFSGFGFTSYLSLKHAWLARKAQKHRIAIEAQSPFAIKS